MLTKLVELGSKAIDTPNKFGCTPLYAAAENGHSSSIEALVRQGSQAIDTPDNKGRSLMFAAASNGHVSVVELLVQLGSKAIDTPDNIGWTPLFSAAWSGHVSTIETLVQLESKAIDTPTNAGLTPMHAAATNGHASAIETLVRFESKAIDTPDIKGRTPMFAAAQNGHIKVIEALVRLGSKAIDTSNNADRSPMYLAAAANAHVSAIEARVQLGSSAINLPTLGRTPLYEAASNGHSNAIEALVRLGSNALDTPDNNEFTPREVVQPRGGVQSLLELSLRGESPAGQEQSGQQAGAASSSSQPSEESRRDDGYFVRLTHHNFAGRMPMGLVTQFGAKIVRLELIHCSIGRLERYKFERMPHLRTVNLSHNDILTIGDAFASNTQLQVLYLDANPLLLSAADLPSLANSVVALSLKTTGVFNLWSTVNVLRHMRALRMVTLGLGALIPTPRRSFQVPQDLVDLLNDDILAALPSHPTGGLRPARIVEHVHYRAFLLAHLPQLWSLDGIVVTELELAAAADSLAQHFVGQSTTAENSRKPDNNLQRALNARELGTRRARQAGNDALDSIVKRSLLPGPQWCVPLAKRRLPFRIRQFEYHPTINDELLFGTTHGQVGLDSFDRREERFPLAWALVGSGAPLHDDNDDDDDDDTPDTILGLHWLRKNPNLFLAGCDSGAIQMFDKRLLRSDCTSLRDSPHDGLIRCYSPFSRLTCVQGNCDDSVFLASGEASNVDLYDMESMVVVRSFEGIHAKQINVLRFANHSPNLFATSSFDKTVKLWDLRCPTDTSAPVFTGECQKAVLTVCFSPDDRYLLSGGENNDVRQWDVASGGKSNLTFEIPKKDVAENWSRAYYLSSGRHVIVGSCREDCIHVVCAQTGKLIRDVELAPLRSSPDLYCLSLRGDPHHPLRFSAIVAIPTPPYYPLQLVSYDLSQSSKPTL